MGVVIFALSMALLNLAHGQTEPFDPEPSVILLKVVELLKTLFPNSNILNHFAGLTKTVEALTALTSGQRGLEDVAPEIEDGLAKIRMHLNGLEPIAEAIAGRSIKHSNKKARRHGGHLTPISFNHLIPLPAIGRRAFGYVGDSPDFNLIPLVA